MLYTAAYPSSHISLARERKRTGTNSRPSFSFVGITLFALACGLPQIRPGLVIKAGQHINGRLDFLAGIAAQVPVFRWFVSYMEGQPVEEVVRLADAIGSASSNLLLEFFAAVVAHSQVVQVLLRSLLLVPAGSGP